MLSSSTNPSRNDGVTILCPVCRRRRFVSSGARECARRLAARPCFVAVTQPLAARWWFPHIARGVTEPSISVRPVRRATLAPSVAPNAAFFVSGSVPAGCARSVASRSPSPIS